MKNQPLIKKLHKPVHPMAGKAVLGAAILLAVGALVFVFQQKSLTSPATNTPTPTQALDNNPTTVPTLPPEYGVHTFTSSRLGISFMYNSGDPQYQKEPYKPTEEGDKVFMLKGDTLAHSKYVEVFSKNPQDSIETAMQKNILAGYSQQDCQIIPANQRVGLPTKPGYQYRVISTRPDSSDTYQDTQAKAQRCPGMYTMTGINGVNYFAMDTNHPDKLLFFGIGQDNIASIPATPDHPSGSWDETIKVLQ